MSSPSRSLSPSREAESHGRRDVLAAADGRPRRLAASGITVRFAGLTALDGADLALDCGEVVGLIGPNGSGKTTLLNVMSGVLRPTAGTVSLDGESWGGGSPERSARMGIRRTFQNIRLFEDMTVLETVEVPAAALGGRRDRLGAALAALDELGLAAYRNRMAQELPYGLQRRLEIARAVAGEPVFLLLDEPAAGLNRAESDELADTILTLRDRLGCGVLLIDHDLRLISAVCSRVTVLNQGSVIASGSPDSVRNDPEVIRAYLG
jgi:ABC-type branched-subunit amino acid transport system ATPase component